MSKLSVLAALQQTARGLSEHRQTHVVWRDWLQKDATNEAVNPHAGSAEFHAGVILDYDRHLANIERARVTVEWLLSAAEDAEAFIGVMFGSVNGRLPETVDTPLGIPVKLGAIARDLRAALAAFRGEQA